MLKRGPFSAPAARRYLFIRVRRTGKDGTKLPTKRKFNEGCEVRRPGPCPMCPIVMDYSLLFAVRFSDLAPVSPIPIRSIDFE